MDVFCVCFCAAWQRKLTCPSIGTGSALSFGASCEHVYSSHITLISSIFSIYPAHRVEERCACVCFLLSSLSPHSFICLSPLLSSFCSLLSSLSWGFARALRARAQRNSLISYLISSLLPSLFSLLSSLISLTYLLYLFSVILVLFV